MSKLAISGLQKTLSRTRKRRVFPRVLFMMIMNLTLGRAKKKNQKNRRRNRRVNSSLVQSL
jgi:hypothetical protein